MSANAPLPASFPSLPSVIELRLGSARRGGTRAEKSGLRHRENDTTRQLVRAQGDHTPNPGRPFTQPRAGLARMVSCQIRVPPGKFRPHPGPTHEPRSSRREEAHSYRAKRVKASSRRLLRFRGTKTAKLLSKSKCEPASRNPTCPRGRRPGWGERCANASGRRFSGLRPSRLSAVLLFPAFNIHPSQGPPISSPPPAPPAPPPRGCDIHPSSPPSPSRRSASRRGRGL